MSGVWPTVCLTLFCVVAADSNVSVELRECARVTEVKLKVRKENTTVTLMEKGYFILMIQEVSLYYGVTLFENEKKKSHVSLGIVDKMKILIHNIICGPFNTQNLIVFSHCTEFLK